MKKGSVIILLLLLRICSTGFGQAPGLMEGEQDSLAAKTAVNDSALAKAFKFTPYKPIMLISSERSFKYQLIKLVRLADGRYLNFYQPTELMFEEIERYSERTKKKMLFLTLAGGLASQTMKVGRRVLYQKNVRFLTPNLSGLHIYSGTLPLKSKMTFRLTGYNEYQLIANLKNGLFSIRQGKTSYYDSMGINWRVFRPVQLFYSQLKYPYGTFHLFGTSFYQKWISLYFVYQKSFLNPRWNRFYIDWQITL